MLSTECKLVLAECELAGCDSVECGLVGTAERDLTECDLAE